jgi:hypothetical protein
MNKENQLDKLLEKVGVTDVSELSAVEKATFDEWQEALNANVAIEDVAKFMEYQVKRLNKDLRQAVVEGRDRDALRITAKLENYDALVFFIREPLERKKAVSEEILNQLN